MAIVSPTDLLFLQLEKRQQPMHVGGLFLFKLPENAPADFAQQYVQSLKEQGVPPVYPFNQVLQGFSWKADDEFDMDHHFRHIALPKPGRIRELLQYVSQEHSALLDRAKPLWEMHLIEGIEGGRFALYTKIHHALVDGVSAMRLLQGAFSRSPDTRDMLPLWSVGYAGAPKRDKPVLVPTKRTGLALVQHKANSIKNIGVEIGAAIRDVSQTPGYTSIFQAPMSVFNQKVTASRRFAAQSYALERFEHIAHAQSCTINDVVLAMCSGAIRAYLLSINALPAKPLVAMVPVNIRKSDDQHGNNISIILANLATHKLEALQRLATIKRSTEIAKKRFRRMSQSEILGYSGIVYGVAGLNLVTGFLPKLQAFNIIISNVPGPKEPLYWNGAQLDAIYPVSVIMDGQALNITLTSYNNKIEVGVTACRKTLPSIQNLLQLFESELKMMEGCSPPT